MHKLGYMTAVGALVLALTACSSGTDEPEANAGTADATPIASTEPTTEPTDGETTAAPLVAKTPDEATPASGSELDAQYLELVASRLWPTSQIADADDASLIAAGHMACDQIKSGTPLADVRVVEGEQVASNGYYMDSSAIMNAAISTYCTEYLESAG